MSWTPPGSPVPAPTWGEWLAFPLMLVTAFAVWLAVLALTGNL